MKNLRPDAPSLGEVITKKNETLLTYFSSKGKALGFSSYMVSLSALAFLWAFAGYLGMRYVETLFIGRLGTEYLPLSNVFLASGMIVFSLFLLKFSKAMGGKGGALGLVLFGAVFYSLLFITIDSDLLSGHSTLYLFLKLCSSIHYYGLFISLWNYLDSSYASGEASRYFGLLTAMAYLGSLTAGVTIHSIGENPRVALLLIASLFTLLYFVLLKGYRKGGAPSSFEEEGAPKLNQFIASLRLSIAHPKTQLLICIHFSIYFVWVIGEYTYMSAISSYFGASEIHKSGLLFGSMGIPNFLFGLVIYKKLIGKIGIGKAVLLTPAAYLAAFIGELIHPSLYFTGLLFIIIEGPFEILEQGNYNLIINTLPKEVKFTTRVLIEFVVGPLGDIASGMFLTFTAVDAFEIGGGFAAFACCAAFLLGRRSAAPSPNRMSALIPQRVESAV